MTRPVLLLRSLSMMIGLLVLMDGQMHVASAATCPQACIDGINYADSRFSTSPFTWDLTCRWDLGRQAGEVFLDDLAGTSLKTGDGRCFVSDANADQEEEPPVGGEDLGGSTAGVASGLIIVDIILTDEEQAACALLAAPVAASLAVEPCNFRAPNGAGCNDASNCQSGHCVDSVCCNTTCGPFERCDRLGSVGVCTKLPNGEPCNDPSNCASDNCVDGVCRAKSPIGEACNDPSTCASGHCVDGVCCATLCDQPFEQCNLPGRMGTCAPDPANAAATCRQACMDAINQVAASSPTDPSWFVRCNWDGFRKAGSVVAEDIDSLVALQVSGSRCHVVDDTHLIVDIDGLTFEEQAACALLAAPVAESLTGQPCNLSAANGGLCNEPSTCASGNCVDAVCCDTACDQPSERCNLPGQLGTCTAECATCAAQCAAAKLKAMTKAVKKKANCVGKALKKGKPVDPSCVEKVELKLAADLEKAEQKGGCATIGDDGVATSLLDEIVADMSAAFWPSFPCLTPDECASESCVGGVCCHIACDTQSMSCLAADTTLSDGICAAIP